jgi:hypothetical protein
MQTKRRLTRTDWWWVALAAVVVLVCWLAALLAFDNLLIASAGSLALGGLMLVRPEYRRVRRVLFRGTEAAAEPQPDAEAEAEPGARRAIRAKDWLRLIVGLTLVAAAGVAVGMVSDSGPAALVSSAGLALWLGSRNRYRRTLSAILGKRAPDRVTFSGYWDE